MIIKLSNAGISMEVEVPDGCEIGHVRSLRDELEEIGAPSSFTLSLKGTGREDNYTLIAGDEVTFRPKSAEKG